MKRTIAIVTSSYNEPQKLLAWLSNYETYSSDIALHIIVDNGSESEYLGQVKRCFPTSTILVLPYNRGMIAAMNIGFAYAVQEGADYIGSISQDMRLIPGSLLRLCQALESDSQLGIVSSVLLKGGTSNIIEEAGSDYNERLGNARKYHQGAIWDPSWVGVKDVKIVSGGMHLARRGVFEKVGFQDESLFMYADEWDFDWRVRQAGYGIGIVRDVAAWHEHLSPNGRRAPWVYYLMSRNPILIMHKHGRRQDYVLMVIVRLVMLIRPLIGLTIREGWPAALAYFRGLMDGLRGVNGPPA